MAVLVNAMDLSRQTYIKTSSPQLGYSYYALAFACHASLSEFDVASIYAMHQLHLVESRACVFSQEEVAMVYMNVALAHHWNGNSVQGLEYAEKAIKVGATAVNGQLKITKVYIKLLLETGHYDQVLQLVASSSNPNELWSKDENLGHWELRIISALIQNQGKKALSELSSSSMLPHDLQESFDRRVYELIACVFSNQFDLADHRLTALKQSCMREEHPKFRGNSLLKSLTGVIQLGNWPISEESYLKVHFSLPKEKAFEPLASTFWRVFLPTLGKRKRSNNNHF